MRAYIYADESGNFDFSNQTGASRYFILTSVTVADHTVETDLLELRRELAWGGEPLTGGFHATNDKRNVRDQVFEVLARHEFRIDATILEKRKTDPGRRSLTRFYSLAWYFHLTGLVPPMVSVSDEVLIIAAAIGGNDTRSDYFATVNSFDRAYTSQIAIKPAMWSAATAPLLQVADYCAWAMQRKWERSDTRAYQLIQDKITSEFDVFRESDITYY